MKARQPPSSPAINRDTIIISLQSVTTKKKFYALSKKMRDARRPIFVGDDLTVGQRSLLAQLKLRTDLFSKVLFRDGIARCMKKDGSWRSFSYLYELESLPPMTAADGNNE